MGILYEKVEKVPNLSNYSPEYNDNGTEKHIVCDGARYHVISYNSNGIRCSEPNCELNRL